MATLSEFLRETRPAKAGFHPWPLYTAEGDSLTFYVKDEESYGERIDDLLTIYKSIQTDEIVGCQIKGVRRKLDELNKFIVTVKSPKLELGLLFLTYMATTESPLARHQYEWFGEQAARLGASLPTEDLLAT
jgi:hypothetical protein